MSSTQNSEAKAKKPLHVAIVGGGFAGLCFATGLQRHQISYQIHEASSTFSEIGAGITFTPNGVNAMRLIHPAIQREFLKHATPNGYGSQRDLFWDCRDGLIDEARLIYPVEGRAYRSIHRATFLTILANLLPSGAIVFDKRLENIKQKDVERTMFFADGSTVTATVVIGCDGVRSSVRQFVVPQDALSKVEPRYSNIYSYRGLVPMHKVIGEIGEALAANAQNYVGHGAHLVTYPIEGGVRKVVSLIDTHDQWARFYLSTPLHAFYSGNIAMIGDTPQCCTPHQGAGASLALEDAYVLANLMNVFCEPREVEAALRAFGAFRRPRTEKAIDSSRDIASIYQHRTADVKDIPSALLNGFNWIWDIDLEEHWRVIERAFRSYLD